VEARRWALERAGGQCRGEGGIDLKQNLAILATGRVDFDRDPVDEGGRRRTSPSVLEAELHTGPDGALERGETGLQAQRSLDPLLDATPSFEVCAMVGLERMPRKRSRRCHGSPPDEHLALEEPVRLLHEAPKARILRPWLHTSCRHVDDSIEEE
jgi:hypothetical protein